MSKKRDLKPDQFFLHKINCPHSTDRVCQLKGDEDTMLYMFNHIKRKLKQKPRDQIEIHFNKQSHVGALVEKYGGFGPYCPEGSLEDGSVTVRFSVPRDMFAHLKGSDGDYCAKSIRELSSAQFRHKNMNGENVLTTLEVTGLPIQVEQVCYMLKRGLELIDEGKAYLRGE